jgi:type IV pilus assembly protein PilY1
MLKTTFTLPLSVILLCTAPALANAVATSNSVISDSPLGTGTGVTVKPNVYFVFDDSGSMAWDYLPDHVKSNYCFENQKVLYTDLTTTSSGGISGSGIDQCVFSDPPYNAASFNYMAYNPSIQYQPAVDADGTNTVYKSMTSANTSGWTVVPKDAFGVLSTVNTNLVTGYPDRKWCDPNNASDCRTNSLGYQYPDLVKYTSRTSITGPAYYYTMSPSYYCTDYTGTNCTSTPDATHTEPFPYLWCNKYTASTQTYSNCQALRDKTHAVPTLLGKTLSVTAATATGGSITVSNAVSYNAKTITAITVAGIPLISSTIIGSSTDTANTLAIAICDAVRANQATSGFDCPITPTGATAYLTATNAGSAYNGPVVVQGTASGTHVYTQAVGSFQVSTPLNTSMKADSILVGTTQLLATTVTATTSQSTTARAFCNAINANTASSQYRARVVSTLGSASPTWGSGTACTAVAGSYVEIQSLINNASENGKIISVSGPAASRASATIPILGNRFAAGVRPGNLGAITVGTTTLFNSIPTSDTTTVSNSNSQSVIDAGLRSKWAAPTGFTTSGTTGNIIITAPAGSAYNGVAVNIASGTTLSSKATTTITFTAASRNRNLTGLTCGGTNVITAQNYSSGGSNSQTTRLNTLAAAINGRGINGYIVSCPTGGAVCNITAPNTTSACNVIVRTGTDSSITISGGTFTAGSTSPTDNLLLAISTPVTFNNLGSDGPIPVTGLTPLSGFTDTLGGEIATTTTPFAGGKDAKQRTDMGKFTRVDIVNDGRTFVKASGRSDCAGGACTYDEEMTNFANWYAYYRTRCSMMKTGVFRAFSPITDDFRVGFNDIYDTSHLDIKDFTLSNKQTWYNKLKGMTCGVSGTPLQGGLSAAGRYYANKIHTTTDPMEYSCQKNFTILSTDGYWNNMMDNTPVDANGNTIGDVDSDAGINAINTIPNKPRAPYRDDTSTGGTLADVAKWYYDHDLRNGPDSVNDAANGWGSTATTQPHYSNTDVHATDTDPAKWQHMVTFTLGLGMDGLLHYDPNYLTGSSPDYEGLKSEAKSWGIPGPSKQENVDDLWHAAVNGHGQYFSARDPNQLVTSLSTALTSIGGVLGAASASATSNMEPVAGDNYLYAASYKTQEWTGDLEARSISVASSTAGQVSSTTLWSAQAKLDSRDLTTSPRVIYTYDGAGTGTNGKAKILAWNNLSSTEKMYFDITSMSNYVASGTLPVSAGCNTTTSGSSPTECQPLLDYLTGSSIGSAAAFRTRTHRLGDIVDTQPVFVGTPAFSYSDVDYSDFHPTRAKMVYVSANDGMLHAFEGEGTTGGAEAWAYVPSFVLPNLWRIADSNYADHHKYFVDGPLTAGDVHINSEWRTVLVGGLAKGGNGYFALDVTDPATPKVLWEFTDARMGYTYGNPVITKLGDGTWVAIVTSGYDNVPAANGGNAPSGDGMGHVYIVNIADGTLMYRIDTGDGSISDPSNLGKVSNWVSDAIHDNTTLYLYGGDMHGNLWRITLPTATPAAGSVLSGSTYVLKLFTAPSGQMITVRPELGTTDGTDNHRMVLFGTGRFLSADDKTDQRTQTIYGLYDDTLVDVATPVPVKTDLVQQTLCGEGISPQPAACTGTIPTTYRTITENTVPLGLGVNQVRGWYVDLPDVSVGSERVNIDPILQLGTLTVVSNVPTSSDCNAGGYSWIYYLDYLTGSFIHKTDANTTGLAGKKLSNALAVGQSVIRIGDKVIVLVTTSDKQYPVEEVRTGDVGGILRRVGWRELISE